MRYSLPTNEVSAQNQLALVKIYVQKSEGGSRPVRIDEIKALSPVKSDRISKCHRFLIDFGLLKKEGHKYRPTEAATRVVGHLADGETYSAQEGLRALVSECWFGAFITEFLKLVGSVDKDTLVQRLLLEAKLPDSGLNREKANVLIDWLMMADFIQKGSNGHFFLNETPLLPDDPPANRPVGVVVETGRTEKPGGNGDVKINLTIEVSLSELPAALQGDILALLKQKLMQ